MKKLKFSFIYFMLLILVGMNSCIEEEQFAEYTIINSSDYNITMVKFGGWDYNFKNGNTLIINSASQHIFSYSGKGGTSPFCTIDSLVFSSGEIFRQTYKLNMPGKSPFSYDYYTGGKTGYKHHITSYQYTYYIKNEDFGL